MTWDERRLWAAGYFPIKLEALPEGTCCHVHVPVFQVRHASFPAPSDLASPCSA